MTYFEPSAAQARHHREAMDAALRESSDSILTAPASADEVGSAHERCSHSADFLDYAAYFDLAIGAPGGETIDAAQLQSAARRLARRTHIGRGEQILAPEPPRISRFSAEMFAPYELAQMHRWWDLEPANRMAMSDPNDEEVANGRVAFASAMFFLKQASPALHDEVHILIRDIVLTKPDGTQRINYSGASSFALWGALTINAETQREWLQVYRQVVHETAHNLLFAISRDGPLVDADPGERRASPIRNDARPLDGIFHAAFVSAREAMAFDLLLTRHEQQACLEQHDDPQILEEMLEMSVLAFDEGIATLRADDVQLTSLGDAVLSECEAYMHSAFAIEAC